MNRESFVRLAVAALRRNAGAAIEAQAEAIASAMDIVAEALGDAPAPTAAPAPPSAAPHFPAPNLESVGPVPFPHGTGYTSDSPGYISPPTTTATASGYSGPPLITLDTKMPNPSERVVDPHARMLADSQPVRVIHRSAATRMKVEDLSLLIQERTPTSLVFDVPLENGTSQRVSFERNVISMHACDSVQLTYFPPNTLPSAREATEVTAVLHVDDVPIDLTAVLKQLATQAIEVIKPKRIPQAAMPAVNLGPVKHYADSYQDPALSNQTATIFGGMPLT